MFSITLRRAAATLGVVAGLLAAAAPASAQSLPGMIGLKAGSSEGVKAPVPANCLVDFAPGVCYLHTVKAPASPTSQVFTSVSNVAPRRLQGGAIMSALNDVEAIDLNALGTQVGSEGVKGPRPALAPGRAGAFQLELEGVRPRTSPASSEEPTETISFNDLKAAGTETGNPERRGSITASGGWDPTHALNRRGIALHAVATAVVGGVVPGGAIVSA